MARQARHSREEFRELALDTAQAIVAEQGMTALTARAVAARMGYSVGMLYTAFDGIEEMIVHMHARTLDALYDALAASPRSGKPEADLQALLDSYLAFVRDRRAAWAMLFTDRQPDGAPIPLPAWYLEQIARVFGLLEEILAPLFAPGEAAARARAARLLWIALHGVWTLSAGERLEIVTPESAEAVARHMVEVFVKGLSAPR